MGQLHQSPMLAVRCSTMNGTMESQNWKLLVWFGPYITSDTISTCGVFTDHEALKTLLNTPHPTGKLAHWGLSLQELDLHTHYSPGAKNGNADALSRYPTKTLDVESDDIAPQVAALQSEVASAKGGDLSLATRQDQDP